MNDRLSAALFTTQGLTPDDSTDAWRSLAMPFFEVLAREAGQRRLDGAILSYAMGDCLAGATQYNARGYRLTDGHIRRCEMEYVFVQLLRSGSVSGHAGRSGDAFSAGSGDVCIFDLSDPFEFDTSEGSTVTLVLPRHTLDRKVMRHGLSGNVLSRRTPMGQALGAHLLTLARLLPEMSQQEGRAMQDASAAMLSAALRDRFDKMPDVARPRPGMRQQLLDYIEVHLASPELSPQHLCERFGMARPHLYRVFGGSGVQRYIQRRRLEAAMRDLQQPGGRRRNISQTAYRWGFSSERQFQRAFRGYYGMTPSEALRQVEHPLPSDVSLADIQKNLLNWTKITPGNPPGP
ncbi:helix-turn-helix domain-containing protein [Franzmannia pantelleriensis]|uniref:helix-turn-helix domain-containing protein n=1 Tax=Franzmannia pantelleriensis TaxID=48727 RepID=UPI0015A3BACA|nr:helix-turn-helix domain-containing protein [Halomonas pantelleriensis]